MLTRNNQHTIQSSPLSEEILCLFIESEDKAAHDYHIYFSNSFYTSTLEEAKKLLKKADIINEKPTIIVIDIPVTKVALQQFSSWVKAHIAANIPIVCSNTAVDPKQGKLLISQKIADDIIDLSRHAESLPEKARFLSQMLQKEATNQVSKSNAVGCKMCNIKRTIDIVVSLVAIIISLPLLLLIALAVKLESKGPILYKAERAGMGYKVFKFFKFRTMVVDADKKISELATLNQYSQSDNNPAFFKIKNDPRVTKIGALLRNTSLDELPQLFNVLKGDMSIVGNRPLPLYEASSLTTNEWAERFMAPAGITGLWQISKRGKEEMSTSERISLDIAYARNRSLKGDLRILLKTPSVLLQKSNV